jgi:hypothetical protein
MGEEERVAYIRRHNREMSEADASEYLYSLFGRHEQKQQFLARGFSNRMAEKALDRQGWNRPFGWRTVFIYPDSNRVRTRYLFLAVAVIALVVWKLR